MLTLPLRARIRALRQGPFAMEGQACAVGATEGGRADEAEQAQEMTVQALQAGGVGIRARSTSKALAAAVACNSLEFFDFVAYAYFAMQIGRTFFAATSAELSLLLSVAVFGVGFVARPLGSIIVGIYADRVGRRPALLLTAALMTIGTMGLVVTPGYAAVGVVAPVVIVLCRLIQGFALGGEIGPSTAFLLELATPGRRASLVSLQLVSQGLAAILAGAIALCLSVWLDATSMAEWGWRIPFAFGALLVPVAFYLRSAMPETLHKSVIQGEAAKSAWPEKTGLCVLQCILVIAGGTVSTYVGTYMATYATTVLKFPPTAALQATVAIGVATVAGAVFGGLLADRFGRWPVMFWPRLAAALLTVPAFIFLNLHPTIQSLLVVSGVLAFLTAMNGSGALTTICELFPARCRATAMAIVYSLGVSMFGGSTQFVVTWLSNLTSRPLTPAWYVVGASAAAVVATLFLPETKQGTAAQRHARDIE